MLLVSVLIQAAVEFRVLLSATPGRLNDLLMNGIMTLFSVTYLVWVAILVMVTTTFIIGS